MATLRRAIVDDVNAWIGLHRGLGGEHRRPGFRRRRNPWLAYVGPGAAGLIAAAAIMLLLSGFGQPPRGKIPPQVLPGIVGTVPPPSVPSGASPEGPPLQPSAHSPVDGRTAGNTSPATTGGAPGMAGAPVPALSPTPTPSATTEAAAGQPPLPPPLPPVATSTPPVCPPLPAPTKKGKGPKPKVSPSTHW